jgi:integrase
VKHTDENDKEFTMAKNVMQRRKRHYRSFGSVRELGRMKHQASYKLNGKTIYAPHLFATITEADNWLAEQQVAVRRDEIPPIETKSSRVDQPPMFYEYAMRRLKSQTTRNGMPLAPSTQAKYRYCIEKYMTEFHAEPVDQITRGQVNDWYTELRSTGHLSTASKAYKILRSILERAVDEEYVSRNPCKIKGAQNASTGVQLYTPSPQEMAVLVRAINIRYRVLVQLMSIAGLRYGEAIGLRRMDFRRLSSGNVTNFEVHVERAIKPVNGEFIVGPPKSAAGDRTIPLPSSFSNALDEHLAGLPTGDAEALVFPSASGGFIHNGVLAMAIKRAQKKVGLQMVGFGPHALRRGAATRLVNNGGNIADLKEFLGDSSDIVALRYIGGTNRLSSLMEKLDVA